MNKYLIFLVLVLISNLGFADLLCVKNNNPVNKKNRVKLNNVLVVSSSCPRGYTNLLDTEVFRGPAGAQGATGSTGAQGVTKKEEFYFRGSTGSGLLTNGTAHYSLIGVGGSGNPADVAVMAGKDCSQMSAEFRVTDAPGIAATGWRLSLVRVADLSTGQLESEPLITFCEILDGATSCSGSNNRQINASDFIALRIAEVADINVDPAPTRGSFLVKCED